ncbi:hypothetical protein BD408DRAFT_443714 [Parasitella parasitica]|nr:hypothetical protein BD408DRAFT_443714 [Parasitella parasitica]
MQQQASQSLDQRLENLNTLPTNFFSLPALPASPVTDTQEEPSTHGKHTGKRRVIVVAYDHSNYGDAMISKSIHLGLIRTSDDIRLLHIVSQSDYRNLFAPMLSANGTSGGIQEDVLDSNMASAADAMVYEVINALKKIGFTHVTSEILRGDPKDSITDYCRMSKPVYLLTGSRGLGAVKRTVMGSVSSYLTRHCPCPVLVCKLEPSEIEARKELDSKKQASFAEVLNAFNAEKH